MNEFLNINAKKLSVVLYIAVGYLLFRVFWFAYDWLIFQLHVTLRMNFLLDLVVGFFFLLFFVPVCVLFKRLLVRFLEK